MKLKRKKIARNIVITLLLILLMGSSVAFGVGYSKQITAYFNNIKVKLNGNLLNFSKEPFIYEGTVYIPLRDVSENLGLEVVWDGNTNTVYLANNIYGYGSTPRYGYNNPYVLNKDKEKEEEEEDIIKELEDMLNDDYEEYTEGKKDLEFEYSLDEKSRYIKVEMEGKNFEKDSSHWEDRDEDEFEDFIEDIIEEICDEIDDMDVKVDVEDEDGKSVGKYEYDESKDKFEVTFQYGSDGDIDDLEEELNDDYDEYTKGDDGDLEFKYSLKEKSDYIDVEMKGKNFKRDSSEWENRDEDKFKDFIEDIAEKICDEIDDMDVKFFIDDKDGKNTGIYEYDEGKDKLQDKFEYEQD
ncbi:copper amine oxidase N-terminal domain-containing protein [Maledivibacter halophilus]|uniref:Copper amine oxidase N-terminal domain-containing protein n=1 Tax=Maledivibacter halophilus TaxID=36842 RepID=A0A1T5M9B7_9FIRM|nr:copper amine oxidase N-terminal domain-containing protein [Maledivibacter halophilus]SKC84827.1 Copper amine oxidase N-terminal domain-containing protein [Maledivibacter halophilus]